MSRMAQRIAIAALLTATASGALAEAVGNVGAVNQSAKSAPPGAPARPLTLGADIVDRERVETGAEGGAQIVFRDSSTLSIGRSSQVTIDRFVYSGGGGEQAVSMAKGALRFVGGGVSHGGGAELRIPSATIGVRGGAALIALDEPGCGALVINQYGVLTIAARGAARSLSRPGVGLCVSAEGELGEPALFGIETIRRLTARLASGPGQHAGAKRAPSAQEAELGLDDARPPLGLAAIDQQPGLETLSPFWTGQALARSKASVHHQPLPPTEPSEDYYYYAPPDPGGPVL
ncbi:FecR family protein [Methylosinus sp. sav-2]|uniref:FecR family protein n=1 Tax=Methylosinus sp. sav-2 TaxID=2485168 RepID=UPI0009FBD19E|nr:FecR family protein [Methylosinus sp. sav-2]TDX60563.1 FecR family protein [Methylosinus sp. sav-2]